MVKGASKATTSQIPGGSCISLDGIILAHHSVPKKSRQRYVAFGKSVGYAAAEALLSCDPDSCLNANVRDSVIAGVIRGIESYYKVTVEEQRPDLGSGESDFEYGLNAWEDGTTWASGADKPDPPVNVRKKKKRKQRRKR